jgi:predicted ABC-type ATPase
MPVLFIITGSNGAGKSTVGSTYLPPDIQKKFPVFDGDKTALLKMRELMKIVRSVKEARKLADEWMYEQFLRQARNAINKGEHFAYEGHFRDKASLKTPRKFKRKGYRLSLIFMGLSDPEQSELRVLDRAIHGGHNVPVYEIQSNFYGNLVMLNTNYKLFDELLVIDTSKSIQHEVLLQMHGSKVQFYTASTNLPFWFVKFLPRLTKIIITEERASLGG